MSFKYWFTRSTGETAHNNPDTPNYVEGEPPQYPDRTINYREKCLKDGFARIGYPNTGDLNELSRGRLAPNGYSFEDIETLSHSPLTKGQLSRFATIRVGDFILIPSDEGEFQVHFGIVLTIDKKRVPPYINPRPKAYYYYHNIAKGDFYECAHRVNVEWAKDEDGEFRSEYIPEIGLWRQAFFEINSGLEKLHTIAKKAKFI